jgi:hypothetical protein
VDEYGGRQYVGIDLHKRRSVIVRMTRDGERIGRPVRIDSDPFELAAQVASWGEEPEVVLEATYGSTGPQTCSATQACRCIWRIRWELRVCLPSGQERRA